MQLPTENIFKAKHLIIGGGPCGMGAACRLVEENEPFLILEKSNKLGGLSGSFEDEAGFIWDYGGHVLFSHFKVFDHYMDLALNKDQWLKHQRNASIYLNNRFIDYPFQNNLHQLDPPERWQCVQGLLASLKSDKKEDPPHFLNWLRVTFGQGITELFMKRYNEKVWAYPLEMMSYQWIAERVAVPALEEVLKSICLEEDNTSWGPNNTFLFPNKGGTGAIWGSLSRLLPKDSIRLNTAINHIDAKNKIAFDIRGTQYHYENIISTIPLNHLINLTPIFEDNRISNQLKYASTNIVGVGINGQPSERLKPKCWMYYPEPNSPYYRVTLFSNYSPHNVAKPGSQWSLMAEVSESSHKKVNHQTLIKEVVAAFLRDGLLSATDEICTTTFAHIPQGYPLPFIGRDNLVDPILAFFQRHNIYSRGRFGAWKYEMGNMDHCFMQGYHWNSLKNLTHPVDRLA